MVVDGGGRLIVGVGIGVVAAGVVAGDDDAVAIIIDVSPFVGDTDAIVVVGSVVESTVESVTESMVG